MLQVKKAAGEGGKLVKGREVIDEAEPKLVDVEAEVKKIVMLSKPEDDGLGVETVIAMQNENIVCLE